MKKVYISGKISGLELDEARYIFNTAAIIIKSTGKHLPVNPFDINPFLGIKNYWCYMISDLWNLMFCDAIYMLDNWKESKGARIEHAFAKFIGLKIMYQKNLRNS